MTGLTAATVLGVPARTLVLRALLVAGGGAAGSVARYVVALAAASWFGATFPWGTLAVNVAGAFIIGLLATLADEVGAIGPDVRALLVVGILGGFTTWSSFSLEAWRLLEQNEPLRAAAYVLGSLALSFAAITAGVALARTGR